MLHGLWKLTWVETKVFVREPMGVIGTLLIPVVFLVVLGRSRGDDGVQAAPVQEAPFNVPMLKSSSS